MGNARVGHVFSLAEELELENAALRALVDHAETLLCNAVPMAHCTQSEWDEIVRKWRDQKHAARAALAGEGSK